MLSEKLKEKTKTAHQELEKLLVYKFKSIQTVHDYLDILINFYQFFTPMEDKIQSHIGNTVPDFSHRRKTEWMVEDFKFFGCPTPQISTLTPLPKIENACHALGAMYVLEGSTLGGKIISSMASKKLNIPPSGGFNFFSGYREATAEMWKGFKDHLDLPNWAPKEEETIIDAANHTFLFFEQSFR